WGAARPPSPTTSFSAVRPAGRTCSIARCAPAASSSRSARDIWSAPMAFRSCSARVASRSSGCAERRSAAGRIEQIAEARRLVGTDHQLLQHAEARLAAPARAHELLDVEMAQRILARQLPGLPVGHVLALPGSMSPLATQVSEPAHGEDE